MRAKVLSLEGKEEKEIELPIQFSEGLREELIRRAFHSERSFRFQPKGVFPRAGLQTTAEYFGRRHRWRQTINTGRSRLPREKLPGGRLGRVLRVPHAVKGRRAHPPKPWKKIRERINLKEKNFAMRSAIAATASAETIRARGHKFDGIALPLVADNAIESLKKAKDAKAVLEKLGLQKDLERARERRRMRSGRSRLRKGGYLNAKSALIIIAEDKGIWKAARNLPGVEVAKVDELSAELLAPGGQAGRLTIWSENAIERMRKENLYA